MILSLDFDGVIHDYKHPVPGRRMGPPIKGAKEALTKFRDQGDTIIIFCLWGEGKGQQTIVDYMKYWGIPWDEITNIKSQADYYIDDKAIRFTNWEEVNEQIK